MNEGRNTLDISEFLTQQQLPPSFAALASEYYQPLCERLMQSDIQVLGINGAQGSGKSTLAAFIAASYATAGKNVAVLSIDDVYLTQSERIQLANTSHPLFRTRGVPGTHDCGLAELVIQQCQALQPGENLLLPRFDKLADDRAAETQWQTITGPIDLVILEGWCVGSSAQPGAALTEPVNELERLEDSQGDWRQAINNKLDGEYQQLFSLLDALILLAVPSFEQVFEWRAKQELQLVLNSSNATTVGMSKTELRRFIQHYERLTRWNLQQLPAVADVTFQLNSEHQINAASYQKMAFNREKTSGQL